MKASLNEKSEDGERVAEESDSTSMHYAFKHCVMLEVDEFISDFRVDKKVCMKSNNPNPKQSATIHR